MLSRFGKILERDGQRDGQTAISISRASVLTRDKKWLLKRLYETVVCS